MTTLSAYAQALNAAQLEAVTYNDGPLLVVAGAGSGKTRVLTYKIAYLLEQGVAPWRIMALTFTNKAAREMNERIASIVGAELSQPLWSGTFHSLFARILRREHEVIGYDSDYTIYDSADSRSLLKLIVRELELDDKQYKPNTVAARISEAKNHLLLPPAYSADASISRRDHVDGLGQMARIYDIYQQRLRAAQAMDFDDLLLNTYLLLNDHPDVRQRYVERFSHILVDEYQDTNEAQHRILSLLTTPTSCISVVGDDAQSIYGFRGAQIGNILQFQERYSGAKVVKLECNYRSTPQIVEAANSIIAHNTRQIPKKVYSSSADGDPLYLFRAETDKDEAMRVVKMLTSLHRQGVPFDDIALLYRTNAQSRSFEAALQSAGVPYRIYGGLSFYQRKEVKDVLAYCRLAVNPHDDEAFRRVVNYPTRGIGATTVQKLQGAATQAGVSCWQVCQSPESYGLPLGTGPLGKLQAFCGLIAAARERLHDHTAYDVARFLIDSSGMQRDLTAERTPENLARQENVDELLGSMRAFEKEMQQEQTDTLPTMPRYLATVSLLTESEPTTAGEPAVMLMTVHAAKGLEFDTVFITGMEDELFPNASALLFPLEMEEERRLFYVAVTRAKRRCILSYAGARYRYGNLEFMEASRFLDEIDSRYVKRADALGSSHPLERPFSYGRGGASTSSSRSSYSSHAAASTSPQPAARRSLWQEPPAGFTRASQATPSTDAASAGAAGVVPAIGARISHERFGLGTVVGIEGEGSMQKVRVHFDQAGTKNLLVKFARFTLVG